MKKYIPIGIFICSLVLSGCGQKIKEIQVSNMGSALEKSYIDVYIPHKLEAGKYEPKEGVYVGAYVENNIDLDKSMMQYEKKIGKEQAFRVFQYKQSGDLTAQVLLECIAAKQTPYIKVLGNKDYDLIPIYQMIGDLNTRYNTPIYIELFPIEDISIDPVEYQKYYKDAYKLIKKYIEDVVIVWSGNWDAVYHLPIYYPGNDVVDWVGLNVFMPKYKEGKAYKVDVEERIDFWYKMFQNDKPMLLSTLAISHFSRVDHTYTIEDAKNKLNYFYDILCKTYPRIKGILYGDVDMAHVSSKGMEDYRLTSQEKLTSHIEELQSKEHFLSEIVKEDSFVSVPVLYKLSAFKIGEKFYVAEEEAELLCKNKLMIRTVPTQIDDKGKKYYSLDFIVSRQEGWIEQEKLEN